MNFRTSSQRRLLASVILVTLPAVAGGCGGSGGGDQAQSNVVQSTALNSAEALKIMTQLGVMVGQSTNGGPINPPGINPPTTVSTNGSVTTKTIDYGSGIVSGVSQSTFSGKLVVSIDSSTNTGTFTCTGYAVSATGNYEKIDGVSTFSIVQHTVTNGTFSVHTDVNVVDNGQAFAIKGDSTYTLQTGQSPWICGLSNISGTVTTSDAVTTVSSSWVATDPGNLFPVSGTENCTYRMNSFQTVSSVVSIDSNTHVTGNETVTVDNGQPVIVQVPQGYFE